MRILISGGFGFIGGRLGQYFSGLGHEVILGSRQNNLPPKWLLSAKVSKFEWKNPKSLENICKDIDIVIHAAGMNAKDCLIDPKKALEFNGTATELFATSARKMKVKHFIYISTAHVYSNPLQGTITEETSAENSHPYASTHLAGEKGIFKATNNSKMKSTVIRLSNAFGSPADIKINCWMLLINDLCMQAAKDGKLVLKSSGIQKRNFISIFNVSLAINHLIKNREQLDKYSIFNLGSSLSSSVIDIAKLVQDRCYLVMGFKPPIKLPIENNDIENIEPLIYRTDKLSSLGLHLKYNCDVEEIDNLIKFCKKSSRIQHV
ncbi:SDR family oxidoreductase [Gammaproteobacteria bacterium]|nr:SDR family oxidoreductase [Gammaproteobacteria bacterium]